MLDDDGLQPLQPGVTAIPAESMGTGEGVGAQRPVPVPVTSPDKVLEVRYSATARRSAPVIRAPCTRMPPLTSASTIACGASARSASGDGARESDPPVWQLAQLR